MIARNIIVALEGSTQAAKNKKGNERCNIHTNRDDKRKYKEEETFFIMSKLVQAKICAINHIIRLKHIFTEFRV